MSTGANLRGHCLTMTDRLPDAFFLPVSGGSLFCLYHAPQGPVTRGRVLHLHPFAEELNTCRRISAQFARALAAAGYAVLQFDMHGCGDSQGDFGEATWQTWLHNAHDALSELNRRAGEHHDNMKQLPLWLWGVRSGALLAADMLRETETPCQMLWWQPVVSGQQVLQQWLRLDAAKEWLNKGKERHETAPTLSEQLKRGQNVHVGGYSITPALAKELNDVQLTPARPHQTAPSKLVCMELAASGASPSPGITKQMQLWETRGWQTLARSVTCPAFWQQFSDADASDLIEASLAALA